MQGDQPSRLALGRSDLLCAKHMILVKLDATSGQVRFQRVGLAGEVGILCKQGFVGKLRRPHCALPLGQRLGGAVRGRAFPVAGEKIPCPDSDSSCRIRPSRSQRGRLLLSETLHRQSRRPCSCLYPSSRCARSVCPEALCR